jgi:hypothetical protein
MLFARQGAVVASWRYYRGRKLGPYFRLAYRQYGRQQFVYLGREGALVQRVRAVLAHLHAPRRAARALAHARHLAMASLRTAKVRLDSGLRGWGLRLKGLEIRGWRTSLLRGLQSFRPQVPRAPRLRVALRPGSFFAGFV